MPKKIEVIPGQLTLGSSAEVVPEGGYEGMDPESRLSLIRLTTLIGRGLQYGAEPKRLDYKHASPVFLERGLYIPPTDPRFRDVEHAVWIGVNTRRPTDTTADQAIIFQPSERIIVARNARDLGKYTVNQTRKARWGDPDRVEASDAAKRSAGHALKGKINSQQGLKARLEKENEIYRKLLQDLHKPHRWRYKVKNLEKYRALADERIHDTVELAVINIPEVESNSAIRGIHKVIRKRIYNGNYSEAERADHFDSFLDMVGMHNKAKIEKLDLASRFCAEEYKQYKPFIDAKEARERAEREAREAAVA